MYLDGQSKQAISLFCELKYLDQYNLQMIHETRMSLLQELKNIGCTSSDQIIPHSRYPQKFQYLEEVNKNCKNNNLVLGALGVGMYPNIIIKDKTLDTFVLSQQNIPIKINSKSCFSSSKMMQDIYCFNNIQIKSHGVPVISDLSCVSPLILILFAANTIDYIPFKNMIILDDNQMSVNIFAQEAAYLFETKTLVSEIIDDILKSSFKKKFPIDLFNFIH